MNRLLTVLEMIKFEHTVFALPFALLGALLAARGLPEWRATGLILLAMIGARSAAMAFNRLVDRHYDALNPRTADRALPAGRLGRNFVIGFIVASVGVFLLAAWNLNPLAGRLAPLALVIVFFYSYTKRFSSFSHLFLGLSLAIAPVGGWVAVRGDLSYDPFILALAVLFWVGGFDIIYACQDVDFDRRTGLKSLPSRWGAGPALRVAAGLHFLAVLVLLTGFLLYDLRVLSWLGLGVVAASLIYEHSLIGPQDLSRVNLAFFTLNGLVSINLLLFVGLDLWLLG